MKENRKKEKLYVVDRHIQGELDNPPKYFHKKENAEELLEFYLSDLRRYDSLFENNDHYSFEGITKNWKECIITFDEVYYED